MKYAIVRLYLYFLFGLFFLTFGLAGIVLFPLYWGAFAPRAKFKELRLLTIWAHMYKIMWRTLTNPGYRAMYSSSKLTDEPKIYTDRSRVRVKESWHGAEDNCDICNASCCYKLKCPLLDKKTNRCLGFGSIYWGYFYCGRYPENKSQIDYYDCPKWEVRPESAKK